MKWQELFKKQLPEPPFQVASRQTAIWLPTVSVDKKCEQATAQMWSIQKFPSRDCLSRDSQGRAREDTGCFCYFLWVRKETESWWPESSKVYLLGCGFLSCKAEGRPHAKMSSYQHELHGAAGRGEGRSEEESLTASDDLQGSYVHSSEERGRSEDKKV